MASSIVACAAALMFSLLLGPALSVATSGGGLIEVEISPASHGTLFETQSISFTCTATGASDITYVWLRNGAVLTGSEVNVTVADNELTVSYLTAEDWDDVTITCRAVAMEIVGTTSVNLIVEPASPTFIQHPQNVTVEKNDSFVLNCSAIGLPTPDIVLLRSNGRRPQPFIFSEISNGVFNFTQADEDFTPGEYLCSAYNTHGMAESNVATVIVFFPPELTNMPEDTNFTLGESAILNCSAKGYPPPLIEWAKNGNPLVPVAGGRFQVLENGSLFIQNVLIEDNGFYMCNASNELGLEGSDSAMVCVHMRPMFTQPPSNNIELVDVDLEGTVRLSCDVMGLPPPTFHWFRRDDCRDVASIQPVMLDQRLYITDSGSLTVTDARRDDSGCYVCEATNMVGTSGLSGATQLRVSALALPPDVLVESIGPSWITVNWTEPDNPFPSVRQYLIEYKLSFHSNWTQVTVPGLSVEYSITSLYPHALYHVRVSSVNELGVGEPSLTMSVMTLPGAPGSRAHPLTDSVQLDSNSSDSLTVTWTVPEVLLMTSYTGAHLELVHPNGSSEGSLHNTTEVTFTNLTPATNYTLRVTFLFAGDFTSLSVVEGATGEDTPGPPVIMEVIATSSTSIFISWSRPNMTNGAIIAYTITSDPPPLSPPPPLSGNSSSFELSGLQPYTDYTISITANTTVGEGLPDFQTVRTLEGVPPAPQRPDIIPINSTSLRVSWQPLASEDVPGILVNYTIKYNKLHHGHSPSFEEVDIDRMTFVLDDLEPYAVYKVSVAAATGAGLGNFSEVAQSRTFGDRPVAMVTMVEVDASCPNGVRVQWAELEPRQFRGPLDEIYIVFNFTNLETGERSSTSAMYTSINASSFVIGGLPEFTNYSVSVAVANINGTGPWSDEAYGLSCDGIASPPTITEMEVINSTAIRLAWQQLDIGEIPGMLIRYHVKYTSSVGNSSIPVHPDRSELTLVELTPYTSYSISIAAETRYKIGPFSSPSLSRTYGAIPVTVLSVSSVTPFCPPVGLNVTWTKPSESDLYGPAREVVYVLSYTSTGGTQGTVNVSASDVTMAGQSLSYAIKGLDENTTYSVSVALKNINGTGPHSNAAMATTTDEGVPSMPENLAVMPLNYTSLLVTWAPPTMPNGQVAYTIYYILTSEPRSSQPSSSQPWMVQRGTSLQATIMNLEPFTQYSVSVSARTSCSETLSPIMTATTEEAISSSPVAVRVSAVLPRLVTLRWNAPDSPNGNITEYRVFCGNMPLTVTVNSLNTRTFVTDCSGLEPETTYNFAISAVNGAGASENATATATTACEDPPPRTEMNSDGKYVIQVDEGQDCSVRPVFILVVVQVTAIGEAPARSISSYSIAELIMATKEYNSGRGKRQASSGRGVYIAANLTQQSTNEFILGNGRSSGPYVNHELEPGHAYNVGLVAQVNGTETTLFTSATPQPISIPEVVTTPPPQDTTPISIVVVAASAGGAGLVLIAIILVCVIICCCRCCSSSLDKVESGGGGRLERGGSFRLSRRKLVDPIDNFRSNHRTEALEEHPPVPVMGFLNKLAVMQTNDNQLFLEEFGSIDMNPQFSTDVANLPLNRAKNRYNNILPYDYNRVKLSSHKHSTDYVNANYLSGYMKQKTYIATQGPIPETISDFWRMVWEQDSRTIVMLTNPQEKSKVKCEVYWPREVGASAMHGNIEVSLMDMTQLADYTIRCFTIHKGGTTKEPREIRHFHFTSWPDHGVPQYATAMLAMLRRVKAWQPPNESGPVIVHCSAGVGRSGTYIVIDTMLERLKNGDELIDIYGHVSLLRTQRPFMVQTEDQYFFIHEAVAEALLCGNTEVKVDRLHAYVQDLCSLIPEDDAGHTHMELQFKRLALDRNDPNRFLTATKDANKSKNRYVNVLPYENNRVCLEYLRGVDGSDYINASHIDSYHIRRAFIATQGPLPGTVVDFWRMVWQYNVPVIVMLTECIEKGTERSACYWPTEVRTSLQYDKFIVELTVERNSTHYSYRDFYITNTETQDKRLVRQFHFHSWPEVGVPSNPMVLVEFIREVQKLYSSLNTKSPLVIHCSNGVGRTGVFIALHIVLERLVVEGLADIFQTVKNLRIQRPAMVQSLDMYHFCYDATVDYIETTDMAFNLRQRSQSNVTTGSNESKRKRHPSMETTPSRSPAKNSHTRSASLTRNTPARTESFKGSARNLELNQLGNGGSQIYGGSEGTSTFGNHRSSGNVSPPPMGSRSGSQVQLNVIQSNNESQGLSQGLSQPLSGSQPQLFVGGVNGGSLSKLNLVGGSQQSDNVVGVQMRPAPAHQLVETQRYSSSSTNRSSYTGEA